MNKQDIARPLTGDREVQIHLEEEPAQQLQVQGTRRMHIPWVARTC